MKYPVPTPTIVHHRNPSGNELKVHLSLRTRQSTRRGSKAKVKKYDFCSSFPLLPVLEMSCTCNLLVIVYPECYCFRVFQRVCNLNLLLLGFASEPGRNSRKYG